MKNFIKISVILFLLSICSFAQGVDAGVSTKPTTSVKKTTPKPAPPKPNVAKPVVKANPKPNVVKPTVVKPVSATVKPKPATVKKSASNAKTRTKIPPELKVFVEQKGVKVFIDDVEYDTQTSDSPFIFDSLSPGNYTIRVEKDGYKSSDQEVNLFAGKNASLKFDLISTSGILDISTNVADASIEVNNQTYFNKVEKLALPEGNFTIKVSKNGYKTVSANVNIVAGQNNIRYFLLEKSTGEEFIAQAKKTFENKNYKETLSLCRQVLSRQPNNLEALSLSAKSYEALNLTQETFSYNSLLLSLGEKIVLPIRFIKKDSGIVNSGFISLQKNGISFWSETNSAQIFQTNPLAIQDLIFENNTISLKGNFYNGGKQAKVLYTINSINTPFNETLFKLLQQVKTGIGYQDNGLGIVYLPSDEFKQIDKNKFGFVVQLPLNWQEFESSSSINSYNFGFAPKGAYKIVNKQTLYTHGIYFGGTELSPDNTNSLDILANRFLTYFFNTQPTYQRKSVLDRRFINGREYYTIKIVGGGTATSQNDIVNFYFTLVNRKFVYFNTVSPTLEEEDYKPVFEKIIASIRYIEE
jgi:hypothetical protein